MARKRKKGPKVKLKKYFWPKKKRQRVAVMILVALSLLGLTYCANHFLPYFNFSAYQWKDKEMSDQEAAFINQIGNYATLNYSKSQVLPSVVIAQAILESDFGKSQLASQYGNLFGRKAGAGEPSVALSTQEYGPGGWVTITDHFKVYPDWQSAVIDHGNLMVNGTDWNPDLYLGVRQARHYRQATKALAEAGYATDPGYADKLNHLIESYGLMQFDP
ncbi:glycoside hydrolase family 73 protein [Aerococcus tenax]|uniref:glycoside hydrolase family 73 protein n=1 Tax=Aerococcus tenax TaxID=3078812 RepID=UPI0018A740A4|nr:glycoside hydrolase family 73 protein [Aerococcus tenax]